VVEQSGPGATEREGEGEGEAGGDAGALGEGELVGLTTGGAEDGDAAGGRDGDVEHATRASAASAEAARRFMSPR
jgi:hypothetical protein